MSKKFEKRVLRELESIKWLLLLSLESSGAIEFELETEPEPEVELQGKLPSPASDAKELASRGPPAP